MVVDAGRWTLGSACTGIGLFDLGLYWAGLPLPLWQVEPDRYCRHILARHFPDADRSIRHVQALPAAIDSDRLPRVDIFVAGFPCQDISQANPNGAGLDGERSGLFWWCLDVIDSCRPRVVVFENVGRLARRGVGVVVAQLVVRGFTVEAIRLRADDCGAPHQRERVFFVAYRDGWRREEQRQPQPSGEQRACRNKPVRRDRARPSDQPGQSDAPEPGLGRVPHGLPARVDRYPWPAARGLDARPWEPPRVVEHYQGRREQLKALGNAVVPQCAYVVGRRVLEVLL